MYKPAEIKKMEIFRIRSARGSLSDLTNSDARQRLCQERFTYASIWRDFHAFRFILFHLVSACFTYGEKFCSPGGVSLLLQLVSPCFTWLHLDRDNPGYSGILEKKFNHQSVGRPKAMKHRTPNTAHRTSNVPDFFPLSVQCWMLDVRCFRPTERGQPCPRPLQ